MTPPASAPEPADWLAALVRALHPARWLLCMGGLAVTAACCAVAQSWLDLQAPLWEEWFLRPGEQFRSLRESVEMLSPAGVVLRLSVPLVVCAGAWCLVGAWVARHELLCRTDSRPGIRRPTQQAGPTALVRARARALLLCCVAPVVLALMMLVPVVIAGRVNDWFGGAGAILVALFLPIVLLGCLLLLVIALGALGWPLMPVAIAAEASDVFDAMSRAYNYFYQRLIAFVVLHALVVALSAAPVAVERFLLADAIETWSPEARVGVAGLLAALAMSVFWSLEPLAYLHLRSRIDEVDSSEIAGTLAVPEKAVAPAKQPAKPAVAPPQPGAALFTFVLALALVTGTWCLTAWLFERSGGAEAGWLGWGQVDGFVPPAQGLYKLASMIAAFWGAILVALPVAVNLRRLLRGTPPPDAPNG